MIAGKISRSNYTFIVLPLQKHYYHIPKVDIPQGYKKGLIIKAYAPRINKDYCLAICGNQKALGNWDPEKAVLMSDSNFPEWQVELDASKLKYPLEYKFILCHKQERKN